MRGDLKTGQQALIGPSAVIAAAAHELKTPLTLITYISQILGDDSLDLSDEDRKHYLQRLQLVSKRTLRLLQHMTMSYRLESQSQMAFRFDLEPVNMHEVCEAALHEMTPYAQAYNQKLELLHPGRSPVVVAHREVLFDVVVNLVDNAIRHNQPGAAVKVTSHVRGPQVRLQVHDSGGGMSTKTLRQLRSNLGALPQPFEGHAGTSGLGLYIVQQLVGAMGGTLGLGRAREGTTFFVDILRSQQLRLL
ncbi:MAG TPA: HAMP domain-containing sensor histidine kinase [Magnetospirillaceae bacterium]|nr:HAMP domain-containing sensor histidine kinase [Magnetospirillaceae bacterium]